MNAAVPILRIFDETRAREFYRDFLGFAVDWEHRFEAGFPLYMQVSSGACILHLSEHYGDASPGAALRIETEALEAFCAVLRGKNHKNCRPGSPRQMPWGSWEITVTDPFGNRLTFYENRPQG